MDDSRRNRGRAIAEAKNQIVRLNDQAYAVRSQSSNKVYHLVSTERGWICSCLDHCRRNVRCKHIHAVEISRRMQEAVKETVTAREVDLGTCKFCGSGRIVKDGIRKLKKGAFQRFRCRSCGGKFIHDLGFERKQATPEQITIAVDLVFSGLSTRKTAKSLSMTGVSVSHVTVMKWAEEYARLTEKHFGKITPQVGEQWRTDELYLKIRGERRYMFAMLNSKTRFWLATMVAEHKGNDDVSPMFK